LRSALVLLALGFAACRTTRDVQKDYAETLRPAPLVAPQPVAAQPRSALPQVILRVRVWADSDYRGQTPRWETRIRDQLDRASEVLEATLGVRLSLVDLRKWERSGAPTESGLDPALAQLSQQDAADDVDLSVGLVSSSTVFTASQEALGRARLFGKHLVLRGMFSLAEYEGLQKALGALTPEENEQLARERRTHKETAVLLHEVAHALGGFHEAWGRSLLSPAYDPRQVGFSPEQVALLAVCVEHRRDKTPESRARFSAAYRAAAAAVEPAVPAEREQALSVVQAYGGEAAPLAAPAPGIPNGPPSGPAAQALFSKATALLGREDLAATDEAVLLLLDVEQALVSGNADAQAFSDLAAAFGRAHDCTGAERAAKRAGPAGEGVLSVCANQRRRASLRAGEPTVPEKREHRYVAAFEQARAQLDRGQLDAAVALAEDLTRRFPGSPARSVITCFARTRQGKRGPARAACTEACAAAPEAFAPRYLLGLVEAAAHEWEPARDDFEKALALDDNPYDAWASLLAVLEKLKDRAAAGALRDRHRQRFGAPVTPVLIPPGIRLEAP
jgi:tetratricopeptide (TPR) repeat protein